MMTVPEFHAPQFAVVLIGWKNKQHFIPLALALVALVQEVSKCASKATSNLSAEQV